MNYQKMWDELKTHMENLIEYHKEAKNESMAKAIHCEVQCREILKKMNELEESNNE